MRISVVLLVLALAAPADAAPAADLVVVWAPGARTAPIETVAHRLGAAVIDRSPRPPSATNTAQLVQQGIEAYDTLHFDDANNALRQARYDAEHTGAAALTAAQLSDLFLYSGLVKTQLGDSSGAWDDLVVAAIVDPTRTLDPLRFPPNVRDEFDRAKETVDKRAHGQLTVQAPEGCAVTVDGSPATGAVDRIVGPHFVRATCPDRAPYGVKYDVAAGPITVPVQPTPYQPPTDSELLVQARVASARAIVFVELHGQVGTARLIGLDGRERDRRTITITSDLAPLADAVADLLAPPPVHHWYRSKWAWAGAAAVLAAAVLVPITAYLASPSPTGSATIAPKLPIGAGW